MNHLLLMAAYAALVGLFFAALSRRTLREQGILFLQIFGGLMIGGLALGWLMYFFPSGPPAPIP
ncbi:MAG: hypothetical protein AAF725_05165 [Acidobacteriota bacterium]